MQEAGVEGHREVGEVRPQHHRAGDVHRVGRFRVRPIFHRDRRRPSALGRYDHPVGVLNAELHPIVLPVQFPIEPLHHDGLHPEVLQLERARSLLRPEGEHSEVELGRAQVDRFFEHFYLDGNNHVDVLRADVDEADEKPRDRGLKRQVDNPFLLPRLDFPQHSCARLPLLSRCLGQAQVQESLSREHLLHLICRFQRVIDGYWSCDARVDRNGYI
mmetsp:Transcript_8182/g.15988  ORF Transcript_8182/g.15988 Transcript_8182/m.15988 type:complete len:216 (+) Transcript_8182:5270-5917(+)